jgi:hypothetical protein
VRRTPLRLVPGVSALQTKVRQLGMGAGLADFSSAGQVVWERGPYHWTRECVDGRALIRVTRVAVEAMRNLRPCKLCLVAKPASTLARAPSAVAPGAVDAEVVPVLYVEDAARSGGV